MELEFLQLISGMLISITSAQAVDTSVSTSQVDIDIIPLISVIFISIILERILAVFYDIPLLEKKLKIREDLSLKGIIAVFAGVAFCWYTGLDAINPLMEDVVVTKLPPEIAYIMTGVLVAGGSQGAVKVFQDIMGFSKQNRDIIKLVRHKDLKNQLKQSEKNQSQAERDRIQAELDAEKKLEEYEELVQSKEKKRLERQIEKERNILPRLSNISKKNLDLLKEYSS